jgi:murein DD-endopeptidase MepM/ murein hydrolase activator NlpD
MTSADGGCGVKGYPCTHWGVDTFTIDGSRDVWAPEAGTVVAVANGSSPPFSGYGPGIVLMLGASGVYHLLAHLDYSTIDVREGQQLAEGEPIAMFSEAYGHCHYEIRLAPTGPSDVNTVDPVAWHAGATGITTGEIALMFVAGVVGLAGAIMLDRWLAGEPVG